MMAVAVALTKATTVFSNTEGTFLRRNLFLLLGFFDVCFAGMVYSHEPMFAAQGVSAMGFHAHAQGQEDV